MSSTPGAVKERIGAIVPAAGSSRRMGRPKLLLPFAGASVIGHTAAALVHGGSDRVMIVAAPDDDPLHRWAGEGPWELAINPDPARGMLSSIQHGLEALGGAGELDTLLVCPADLPLLRADTVARLIEARADHDALLAIPTHEGRRGHPLVIAGDLLGKIALLDPSIGLRQLLLDHPEAILAVVIDDPGAYRDMDTPSDYRLLQERMRWI